MNHLDERTLNGLTRNFFMLVLLCVVLGLALLNAIGARKEISSQLAQCKANLTTEADNG